MAEKQSTMPRRCLEVAGESGWHRSKKIMDSLVECWNGPRRRQPCLLRILRYNEDGEVSNASARDCEDWGFKRLKWKEKEEEGLALAAACRLTK